MSAHERLPENLQYVCIKLVGYIACGQNKIFLLIK